MRTFWFPILLFLAVNFVYGQSIEKNRVIILTDIENEPDDTQSMVRLLLYSSEIDIEGIVATTCYSMLDAVPQSIIRIIQALEKEWTLKVLTG